MVVKGGWVEKIAPLISINLFFRKPLLPQLDIITGKSLTMPLVFNPLRLLPPCFSPALPLFKELLDVTTLFRNRSTYLDREKERKKEVGEFEIKRKTDCDLTQTSSCSRFNFDWLPG